MKTLVNYELDPELWTEGGEPYRANNNDVGIDLRTPEPFCLYPGDSKFVDLGIRFEFRFDQWGLLSGRSGLARDHRITLLNGVGIIDPGYRGNVGAMFINHGPDKHHFSRGDRVAQLVVVGVQSTYFEQASAINVTTERGTRGFGSSGK